MALDLNKKVEQINLVLKKKNIPNIVCRVKGSLDASGSMQTLYDNGTVQETINRLFALGYRFDDNKMIDLSLFSDEYINIGEVALEEVSNIVNKKVYKRAPFSITIYAKTLNALADHPNSLVSKFKQLFFQPVPLPPAYVILITDGENSDIEETKNILDKTETQNIFYVFVGIGNSINQSFLKSYAQRPHVDYILIQDLNKKSDAELYEQLISNKFLDWMKKNHSAYLS